MKSKFKLTKKYIIPILLLLLIPFCYWQNNGLMVTNYIYTSEKVPRDLEGYRIVQISDLHNKRFGSGNEKLLEKIKKEQPDMIVVTGDLIDSNHTNVEAAVEFMEAAATIAPVYYITGNHEEFVEPQVKNQLLEQIEQAGAILLDDSSILMESGESSFRLIGLANKSLLSDKLIQMTEELDTQRELVVLLAHEPQYINSYSSTNVDLVLSGHAHGGQFRLPFIGGLVAPDQGLFPKYTEGVHKVENTTMIISRGLGNSIVPLRLFNRPEVVCVELRGQ